LLFEAEAADDDDVDDEFEVRELNREALLR
jgi:hypothetical protein